MIIALWVSGETGARTEPSREAGVNQKISPISKTSFERYTRRDI